MVEEVKQTLYICKVCGGSYKDKLKAISCEKRSLKKCLIRIAGCDNTTNE